MVAPMALKIRACWKIFLSIMCICKQLTAVKIKQFYLYYYGTITFLQMSTTIDILYVSRYKLVTLTNHVYKLVPGHIQKSITLFSSGHPLYSLLFRYRYKYKYRYKNTMSVPYSSCITLTYKNVKQSTTIVYASKNKNKQCYNINLHFQMFI